MKKEKVIVGMSGGVDSSVVALLLLEQGYDVEGLFMRNWDSAANNDFLGHRANQTNDETCLQEQDYQDALKVAEKLKIKLHRVNFVQEYWDDVFSYFLKEYQVGRTPNPDILCNKYIKFDKFLNHAMEKLGADKIAMGHYAGVQYNAKTKQFELLKALDQNKDQTYFLAQLNQKQLSHVLFPLQGLTKPQIRQLANDAGLITADKKDSTGICFIGEREFRQFLENYIPNQPGKIVDIETKKVIGHHVGVMYYTLGQRKGLNLGGMSEPYYVVGKNIEEKILYVTKASDESYLMSSAAIVEDMNWIVDLNGYVNDPQAFTATAKFRYRQAETPVLIHKMADQNYLVKMATPLKAITPGQEAVFYLGDLCLGGGIIQSTNQKLGINL